MAASRKQLLQVLLIARDHSCLRGGRGLSLRQLIEASGYRSLRHRMERSQLAAVLRDEPAIVDDWLAYSEDKRTSCGWGFGPSREGGWSVDGLDGICDRFVDREDACAEFVLRELDYWSAVDAKLSR